MLEPMPSEDVPADSAWQQRAKAAEDRVDAALARHPRDASNPLGPWCPTCLVSWPCGTVLDLAGETARIDPEELAKFLEGAEERRRQPAKRDLPEDFAGRLERMVRAKVAAELRADAASHRRTAATKRRDLRVNINRRADILDLAARRIERGEGT